MKKKPLLTKSGKPKPDYYYKTFSSVRITFKRDQVAELKKEAAAKGITISQYVRILILERHTHVD